MKEFFATVLYEPFYNLLILIVWLTPGHYVGVAIVILTLLTRVILLPSSLKAARFQVKNTELQPKINKIKAEIKDSQEQTKAIMALYKEEGHSPLGSCLPLLIQMPILIVLYSVFSHGLTVDGFSALYSFVPRPDTINTAFLGFDLTKKDPWVLPIVAAAFQFLLSFMMLPKKVKGVVEEKSNDPMAMMNKQMLFLPAVITVFFGRSMPSALVIYWIMTTLFSIGQQWYVNKEIKSQSASWRTKIKSIDGETPQIPQTPETPQIEEPEPKKKDLLTNIMNRRLDKQEKRAGVSVTVRTKKKS